MAEYKTWRISDNRVGEMGVRGCVRRGLLPKQHFNVRQQTSAYVWLAYNGRYIKSKEVTHRKLDLCNNWNMNLGWVPVKSHCKLQFPFKFDGRHINLSSLVNSMSLLVIYILNICPPKYIIMSKYLSHRQSIFLNFDTLNSSCSPRLCKNQWMDSYQIYTDPPWRECIFFFTSFFVYGG